MQDTRISKTFDVISYLHMILRLFPSTIIIHCDYLKLMEKRLEIENGLTTFTFAAKTYKRVIAL